MEWITSYVVPSPSVSMLSMLSQIDILVLLSVGVVVDEQRDGPQAGQAQQPEAQQNQPHAVRQGG